MVNCQLTSKADPPVALRRPRDDNKKEGVDAALKRRSTKSSAACRVQGRGVRCWLDEKQMLPGDDIYEQVDRGIRL